MPFCLKGSGFIFVNKTNLEMTTKSKQNNKKILFLIEMLLKMSHTHTQ